MTSPKKRHRARRRVERMIDDAYEALSGGQRALADKLSRRAVEEGHVNPRVWLERGRIARELGDVDEAEQAFRQAIARADTFAAAFAELAHLQASRGKLAAAERLMRRAVELAPGEQQWCAEHAGWASEAGVADVPREVLEVPPAPIGGRWARFAEGAQAEELRVAGAVRMPGLLDRQECAFVLGALRSSPALGHGIEHDGETGRYTLWFVDRPPPAIAELVTGLQAVCARLAEAVFVPLGRPRRPVVPSCALIEQPKGGFTPPATGEVGGFPLRAEVCLSGTAQVVLADVRPGRRDRSRRVRCGAGDAVLAGARERVVRVGGVDGLQVIALGVEGESTRLRVRFDPVDDPRLA